MWMAGGGIKPGTVHGETDDFSYNIVKDPVHIRDFHATVLHLLGFDHERFTYRYQGLDQKLTGVEKAHVMPAIDDLTRNLSGWASTRSQLTLPICRSRGYLGRRSSRVRSLA